MTLQIKNLTKAFGGVRAVDRCSFEIKENKITSIIGPNGAGKTTLFNLISGLIKPDRGKILFNKKDLTKMPPHKIARLGISRTFQLTRVFKNMTVKDNLQMARKADKTELEEAMKQVHIKQPLDKIAGELSYGQGKLLAIARALLFPHTVLMLDEPAAGVNPKVRQELKCILRGLKKQHKTIIIIEHDMDFVMDVSDEIVVLNEGRVLKTGKPAQVRKDKKVLEAYLGK